MKSEELWEEYQSPTQIPPEINPSSFDARCFDALLYIIST